jgi:hypothetical protein
MPRGHAGHHGHAPASQQGAAPQQAADTGNYGAYDQPAYLRRAVGDQLTDGSEASFDLLDVPAFLRRQAD